MNGKQLERLLLLEQSGELSPRQRRDLESALAAAPDARRLRADLRRFAGVLAAPTAQPAPDAAAKIAARLRPPAKPAFSPTPAWKPALAAAAALALLFGARSFRPNLNPSAENPADSSATAQEEDWTDPLETEFTELESLLAALAAGDSLEMSEL